MKEILLIEDDQNLGTSLLECLQREGFKTVWKTTLKEAKEELGRSFGLIILDWMLPDGQGIDLVKELRKEQNSIPLIMLTARTDLIDKVLGLESGANDYLTKPFEMRELVARIRVQLREKNSASTLKQGRREFGALTIDYESRDVYFEKRPVELTKMEFDLLKLLTDAPGRVFSRDEILNKVWGYENYPSTRTVDTHILQLRHKIHEQYFETIRGIGYKFSLEFSNN